MFQKFSEAIDNVWKCNKVSEADVRRYSSRQVFFKMSQISRENNFFTELLLLTEQLLLFYHQNQMMTQSFQQKLKPHKLLRKKTKTRGNHS